MIMVAAVFQGGKRFEDYLHEIEMIEVDTEFPTAWLPGGLPDDTRRAVSAALKLSELAGSSFVIAEGDSVTLYKAWERACNRGLKTDHLALLDPWAPVHGLSCARCAGVTGWST